jgi:hypothetical protein
MVSSPRHTPPQFFKPLCREPGVTIRANGAMVIFGRPHQVISDSGKKRAEPKLNPSEHLQFQVGSVVVGQKHVLFPELRDTWPAMLPV